MTSFGWRDLWRVSFWGLCAASAMMLSVAAATTETGRGRLHEAFNEVHEILIPSGVKAVRPLDALEGRRLADTVRALAADRERLVGRIAQLEQSLDTVTGSIAKVEKSIQAPQPAPEIAAPAVQPPAPAEEVTSSIAVPPAAASSPPNKPEFAVDLGSAGSVEALRTAWNNALKRHVMLLGGLRPVVQVRDRPKPANPEFRLVAGPIANAAAAARICAAMTAAGAICAPAVFDGQRLAVR